MSEPLTGDRGCEDVFKKHGNSMWQVDGKANSRGKAKRKDKPGEAFDAMTGHQHMREWRNELNQGVGDSDASAQLISLAAEAQTIAKGDLQNSSNMQRLFALKKQSDNALSKTNERPRPEVIKLTPCSDLLFPEPIVKGESASARKLRDETLKELFWALRNQVYELRALNKEYVGRTRSLRFFKAIEQAHREFSTFKCLASKSDCDRNVDLAGSHIPLLDRAIFTCCGHVGEISKMRLAATRGECPVNGCCANVRFHSIVECASLSSSANDTNARVAAKHGAKLAKIIDLINGISKNDRILVFVQFEGLLARVHAVLKDEGIPALKLRGTAHQMSAIMSKFQKADLKEGDERILLLELHNESASGANLTTANHVIFVHPLHVKTLQNYIMCETQAIGRVRRYGQQKIVKLYRFLVTDSVDVKIYERRYCERCISSR